MRPIDSLLNLLIQQEGTELRLSTDQPPRMLRGDIELPLTVPATPAARIRVLLGDLWTANEAALREEGCLTFAYDGAAVGGFAVRLEQAGETGLDVVFRRATATQTSAPASPDTGGAAAATQTGVPGTAELPEEFAALVARAAARGASDLHLSPRRAPILRVDGSLEVLEGGAGFDATTLLGGGAGEATILAGGSVDRSVDVSGVGRLRLNVYRSDEGLCVAARILQREPPSLPELSLPSQVETLVDLPHGLVIACGPTGSGKSTTLAALIQNVLSARPRVLVTLEDPIEYLIRPSHPAGLVRQREVGTHVRDFATGLRDALREDPDVLLVGEMRDPETIALALTAAETGHLVFASLHSRTAPSAIERIIDTYPSERQRQIRVQLADALRVVISQRLVPAAGGGRVPAVELLRVTHGVANLIRDGRTAQIVNALQGGGNEGMLILERHLAELVRTKRIAREIALATANDPSALADYLRAPG